MPNKACLNLEFPTFLPCAEGTSGAGRGLRVATPGKSDPARPPQQNLALFCSVLRTPA